MKVFLALFLSLFLFGCESSAQAEQPQINHPRQVSCVEASRIKTQQQQIFEKLSSIEDRMGDLHAK